MNTKLGTKTPIKLLKNGVLARSIRQGGNRVWEYDPTESDGDVVYSSEVIVGSSFNRWVNNRGQGTRVASVRFGSGDQSFGGVTWKGITSGTSITGAGGFNFHFRSASGATGNTHPAGAGANPGIAAFDVFAWSATNDYRVLIEGLTPGRSYSIQVVVSDNRTAAGIPGRKIQILPVSGLAPLSPSSQVVFAGAGPDSYAVVSLRFTATSSSAAFSPLAVAPDGTSLGTQINACNLLVDVLPSGKVYYVSESGSDSNDGMSRNTPWLSIDRVNETTFSPGDRILFQRGGRWNAASTPLYPKGNGAVGNPIILGAYGDGAAPLIEANGRSNPYGDGWDGASFNSGAAIYLNGQSHVIIDGFECTNWPAGATYSENIGNRRGILCANSGDGIVIRNCYVHDVLQGPSVNEYGRYGGGIRVAGDSNRDSVLIENNIIEDVIGLGIFVGAGELFGPNDQIWQTRMYTNVVVRGNVIHNTSVDSVLILYSENPVIEHNHCSYSALSGRLTGSGDGTDAAVAGMWTQYASGGVQQFNHCHDGRVWKGNITQDGFGTDGYDGQALGIDYNMSGETVLRYNYIHDTVNGIALDNNYGAYNFDNPRLTVHHNIAIDSPRLTSGRPEFHFGNIYYSPEDEFRLDWGAHNLDLKKNIFVVEAITNKEIPTAISDNVWNPISKPVKDTPGVSANPLFTSPPKPVIFRDTMIHYPQGSAFNINAGPDGIQQIEPRWYGALRNISPKYSAFLDTETFKMGGSVFADYRMMTTDPARRGFIALGNSESTTPVTVVEPGTTSPVINKPITVRFMARSKSNNDNWLAFNLSRAPFPSSVSPLYVLTSDYGILFRSSGAAIQSFKSGAVTTASRKWVSSRGRSFPHVFEIVLSNSAGTGAPIGSGSTRVRVYSDGLLIDDQTMSTPFTGTKAYVGLESYESEWRIIGLEVFYGTSQDRFRDYEGLVPTSSSPIAPATSSLAPAGAKDFISNPLDSNPKRGAYAVTTLSSYVQTPSRIEIKGRYEIAKPTSGSLPYNYDSIIRDQNNRVIASPVTWSLYPTPAGVTVSSQGVVSVSSSAVVGTRFALKATYQGVVKSFPIEITA